MAWSMVSSPPRAAPMGEWIMQWEYRVVEERLGSSELDRLRGGRVELVAVVFRDTAAALLLQARAQRLTIGLEQQTKGATGSIAYHGILPVHFRR